MGFTTPCFIRKNTPELKKKLEDLGYKDYGNLRFYGDPIVIYCNLNHFFTSPFVLEGEQYRCKYDNFIDCGDNEELFLEIASKRDDTPCENYIDNEGGFACSLFCHFHQDCDGITCKTDCDYYNKRGWWKEDVVKTND